MNIKTYQQLGEKIEKSGVFCGCNIHKFASTSRDPLSIAIRHGLTKSSKVLDIGCGCCRTGYWFIDYLDQGNYHGIEPNVDMLDAGKQILFPLLLDTKAPRFSHNDDFDLSVFNENFDFVIAFSIFSHAPKSAVIKVIRQLHNFKPCTFLGTVIFPSEHKHNYQGEDWVGCGTIAHDWKWLSSICKEYYCNICWLVDVAHHQNWIRIVTK